MSDETEFAPYRYAQPWKEVSRRCNALAILSLIGAVTATVFAARQALIDIGDGSRFDTTAFLLLSTPAAILLGISAVLAMAGIASNAHAIAAQLAARQAGDD